MSCDLVENTITYLSVFPVTGTKHISCPLSYVTTTEELLELS